MLRGLAIVIDVSDRAPAMKKPRGRKTDPNALRAAGSTNVLLGAELKRWVTATSAGRRAKGEYDASISKVVRDALELYRKTVGDQFCTGTRRRRGPASKGQPVSVAATGRGRARGAAAAQLSLAFCPLRLVEPPPEERPREDSNQGDQQAA